MRSVVVFLSACGAFGSTASTCESDADSQALLQSKKVVRHQLSQKADADDVLSSMQKVAGSFMKGSSVTMTPEEVNAAIGQAQAALTTMFPMLTQQHELAQQEIQHALGAISACHDQHGNGLRAMREQRVASNFAAIGSCEEQLTTAIGVESTACDGQGVHADCECTEARTTVTDTRALCAAESKRYEAVFCENQLFCDMLHECHAQEVSVYQALVIDLTEAMEARQTQYVTLTQSDCIMNLIMTAMTTGTPIDNQALTDCGTAPDHLTLDFPTPPQEAEPCHMAGDGDPQCQFAPTDLQCGAGSPSGCQCSQVQLSGVYSAGPVIRCDGGIDVHHTSDQNSCPVGWKIFSPQSQADWEVLRDALGDHDHHIANPANTPNFQTNWPASPWLIVDVSRSDTTTHNAIPRDQRPAMNSANPGASAWHTSDGSPFWLREGSWGQPDGNYHGDCFLDIFGVNPGAMRFDDHNCVPHSSSYLCQREDFYGQTADGCPRDNSNSANRNGNSGHLAAEQDASDFSGQVIATEVHTSGDHTASVRCCSMDGSSCSTSDLECHSGKTLAEAEAICASHDMRLCTEHEMADNVCCNSGCWFNHHAVWVTPSTLGSNPRADTKCPHNHADRLFREESITRAACFAMCQTTENCNAFSYGHFQGTDVCMGCTTLDNAQHHSGFTAYDM